ncbi:MAG: hypothetical protein WAR83_05555 [Flavobacteriales bacterium]
MMSISCNGQDMEMKPNNSNALYECASVSTDFSDHVRQVLSDSANMFQEFPDPPLITCEILEGMQNAFTNDSVRIQFEHLSQRYWHTDPHYNTVQRYIERHLDFHLSIAQTAHFFGDVRIMGIKNLQEYRRMRPLVCSTKEHYDQLEVQDHQAVRYLLYVLENTPWFIGGSENATIHGVYIKEICRTLDLFTGQEHIDPKDLRQNLPLTETRIREAIQDWRKWLEP